MCCPLGICEALCFNSLEKFNIKSPRTLKQGILFFALSSKYFASFHQLLYKELLVLFVC